MKENVLDVLMYLFETYIDAEDEPEPDQNELRDELARAGFGDSEIDRALDWLDKLDVGARYFLWVHFYDPHEPYEPPRAFWQPGPRGAYDGDDWGATQKAIEEMMNAFHLPAGYSWSWNDRIVEQANEDAEMGVNFLLALVLMSAIRTRLETEKVPKYLKGVPIAFISGGLMALAFMAFDKALLTNLLG